jgi:hypothetical protein
LPLSYYYYYHINIIIINKNISGNNLVQIMEEEARVIEEPEEILG